MSEVKEKERIQIAIKRSIITNVKNGNLSVLVLTKVPKYPGIVQFRFSTVKNLYSF